MRAAIGSINSKAINQLKGNQLKGNRFAQACSMRDAKHSDGWRSSEEWLG